MIQILNHPGTHSISKTCCQYNHFSNFWLNPLCSIVFEFWFHVIYLKKSEGSELHIIQRRIFCHFCQIPTIS